MSRARSAPWGARPPRSAPRLGSLAAPRVALLLLLLALTSSSARQQQQQRQQYDCSAGCALSLDLVCGEDGLTYAGECLAVCSGAAVAAPGGCEAALADLPPAVAPTRASAGPAAAAAAPAGLAGLLDLTASSEFAAARPAAAAAAAVAAAAAAATAASSSSSDGEQQQQQQPLPSAGRGSSSSAAAPSATPTAPAQIAFTRADIERYADQGFALLGPARTGSFKPSPWAAGASPGGGGGGSDDGDGAQRSSSGGGSDVRAVRVASDTGLLYATQGSVLAGGAAAPGSGLAAMAALLSGGGAPPPGWRPARGARVAGSSSNGGSNGSGSGSGNGSGSSSGSDSSSTTTTATSSGPPVPMGAGMNDAAWLEITTAAAAKTYPYSAAALIQAGDWGCSGARISKWSVLTAGHCVYDHPTKTLQRLSSMRVRMARYASARNGQRLRSPFAASAVRSFTYFVEYAQAAEWKMAGLDVAVLELATNPGKTGTLGVASRDAACGLALCPSDGDGGGPGPSCPADSTCATPMDSVAYPMDSKVQGQLFRYRELSSGRATLDTDAQDGAIASRCFTGDSRLDPVLPRIEPGMSGSALWTIGRSRSPATKAPPPYHIVGVLSGVEVESVEASPLTCNGTFAYTEVTRRVFDMVTKAAADYDAAKGKARGTKGVRRRKR